jgi:hypothetical protein
MNKKRKITNFFTIAEKSLPQERVEEASREAQKEILKIKLSEIRKQFGIKQTEISGFSQPAISRLEARKDMKVSTLMDYIHSLGLEIQIKVKDKKKSKGREIILIER